MVARLRLRSILVVFAAALLGSCAGSRPFFDGVPGDSYSVEQFDALVRAEKVAYLKGELAILEASEPGPAVVKLSPFMMRTFPSLDEWRRMKAIAQAGDRIVEYRHRHYGTYDGPDETLKRGYALLREGRILTFISVAGIFPSDY